MERFFTGRELVNTSSRLERNAAYVTLAANNNYRRRITLLLNTPSVDAGRRHVVAVEYFGTHVCVGAPHGNTKHRGSAATYVRTPVATMDTVRELNANMPAQAAYN